MTDKIAAISPNPVPAPAHDRRPDATTGLEDDTLEDTGQFWSTDEGPTFAEFLDIINPLQHIPVVSTIYRAITEDEIGNGPRFLGGMLFGGPIGALAAGMTALFEEASGGDMGKHLASLVNDVMGEEAGQAIAEKPPAPGAAADTAPQQAALSAAGALNRISLNPAAALGVPQSAQPSLINAGTGTAFPAGAMAVPFAATPRGNPMPAAPASAGSQQMQASLAKSRRQQADLLLAKWAAQQMEQQKQPGRPTAAQDRNDGAAGNTDRTQPAAAAPHPMLPPRNATPEWYAQAMDKALNQYRGGLNARTAPASGLSIQR